jgi:L-lactate dehydrogenase complex protein LldE
MNVQIFIPCFVDQLYPETGFNMVKVLEKAGCKVNYNPNQTCCGQPAFNAGFWDEARDVARKFIKDFEGANYIIMPSASCAGFVKNYYPKLFENLSESTAIHTLQKHVFEFSTFLTDVLKVTDIGATLNARVTWHDSCAALRECQIKSGPRTLLQHVNGLELVEMNEAETCCGFGGTFAVKFPEISSGMGSQKLQHIIDTGAQVVVSTDLSCLMQIQGMINTKGADIKTMHLADVLASGY